MAHVVDFSCYKLHDCEVILDVLDRLREASLLEKDGQKLRYVFISTDSTYDASAYLLDAHKHKFVPPAFMKADRASLPKLPKHDRTRMYTQAYGPLDSGIIEPCAYSEHKLQGVSPDFQSHVN